MSSYTNAKREFEAQRTSRADAETVRAQAPRCAAQGCPNPWSVQQEGYAALCSFHAEAKDRPREWPAITAQQQALAAVRSAAPDPLLAAEVPRRPYRAQSIEQDLRRLQGSWSEQLRARELRGDALTKAQRDAWRSAERATAAAVASESA